MTGQARHDTTAYTLAEEIANAITHGIGAALSIAGLVVLVVLAAIYGSAWSIVAVGIYGSTLVLAYLSSTLYHSIPHRRAKRVLQVLDHSMIFLLIAGTYTPVAMLALASGPDWLLLVTIWSLAVAGIVLQIVWPNRYEALRVTLYVVMGWLVLAWAGPLVEGIGWDGTALMVVGGVAYTAGIGFYAWDRLPFNHAVWHLFVMGGSAAHFFAILYFVPFGN